MREQESDIIFRVPFHSGTESDDTLFLNVKETDAANLTRTGHPLGWLLTVLQKENADKTLIKGALLEAISRLNTLEAAQTAQRRRAIVYLILLILHRRPSKEREELLALIDEHTDTTEVESMAQSIIELSEKRGETRGETRAKQAAVLKLLQIRFDPVPEIFISEINSIRSLSRLDSLFERVATAQTLDEIEL